MSNDDANLGENGAVRRELKEAGRMKMFSARRRIPAVCVFLLLLFASAAAFPDDMPLRCKNGSLVQVGDDEAAVRQKCGEPYRIVRANPESQTIRGHKVTPAPIMKWSYNMGSTDYIYTLTFEEGKLVDIETEGRGFAIPNQ